MFYCTVRQFAELLGVTQPRLYKAINNGELRPSPGTQPYLINEKEMEKFCRAHDTSMAEVANNRALYFYDCLNYNTNDDTQMPVFAFSENEVVRTYDVRSTSTNANNRDSNTRKSNNKGTKVHVDTLGTTGCR